MEAITLHEASAAVGGIPLSPLSGLEEPEPIVEVTEPDEGSEGTSEEDLTGRAADLLNDLRRRTSPTPTLVEADPIAEAEAERLRIEARAAALDRTTLLDGGSLELDRLSALRPELAFLSPSIWVLVQNPTEVVAFMVRNFGGTEEPRAIPPLGYAERGPGVPPVGARTEHLRLNRHVIPYLRCNIHFYRVFRQ